MSLIQNQPNEQINKKSTKRTNQQKINGVNNTPVVDPMGGKGGHVPHQIMTAPHCTLIKFLLGI